MLRKGSGDIVVFAPFTRLWCVERFYAALAASDVPFHRCRYVAFVDSDDPALLDAVTAGALALPFAEVVVHCTAWEPPAEFCRSRERRGRHSAMRCASVGLIPDAKYLLLLEDDTLIPPNSWKRLRAGLSKGYDWVCGFEVGRWRCPCPGIWDMSTPGIRRSKDPGKGLEPCDATGVYLVLTTPDVYRALPWDVWDNNYGHDVSITWLLTQKGYKLGVDWSLECIHITEDGDLTCDMWGPTQNPRGLPDFTPVLASYPEAKPLDRFQESGPTRVAVSAEPGRKFNSRVYALGKTVVMDGVTYLKGDLIDHETAVAMSAAGVIGAKIT